jgi:hypothetical protein
MGSAQAGLREVHGRGRARRTVPDGRTARGLQDGAPPRPPSPARGPPGRRCRWPVRDGTAVPAAGRRGGRAPARARLPRRRAQGGARAAGHPRRAARPPQRPRPRRVRVAAPAPRRRRPPGGWSGRFDVDLEDPRRRGGVGRRPCFGDATRLLNGAGRTVGPGDGDDDRGGERGIGCRGRRARTGGVVGGRGGGAGERGAVVVAQAEEFPVGVQRLVGGFPEPRARALGLGSARRVPSMIIRSSALRQVTTLKPVTRARAAPLGAGAPGFSVPSAIRARTTSAA